MKESEERPDANSEKGPGSKETPGSEEERGAAEGRPAGPVEVQASDVTSGGEAPAERVAKRRAGKRRRYFPTIAVSAAVVLVALAVFMAGFGTHYLLDDDVDLTPVEDKLVALEGRVSSIDQRTGEIQDILSGAVRDAGGSGDGGGEPAASPEAAISEAANDDPSWGPKDASVVIVEFADFQCPFCARHAQQTLPGLKKAYGDKVRYIYRDFPISSIHPFAQKAAEAGQCAQDQGLFWEYHDLLFANQDALAVSDLKSYAKKVGADSAEFNSCLDSGKNQQEVLRDLQDGGAAGVTGTPGFLINGQLVTGAQPLEQFQKVIDQFLAAEQ